MPPYRATNSSNGGREKGKQYTSYSSPPPPPQPGKQLFDQTLALKNIATTPMPDDERETKQI